MSAKNKKAKKQIKICSNIAAPTQKVQMPAGEHYVLTVEDYNLIQGHIGQINEILARSRVNGNVRESVPGTVVPVSEKLTDAVVNRLVGHTNVVYYNCEINAWNTSKYNGYTITGQYIDTQRVREFKSEMEKIPEFSQHYDFAASVTMTISKALFPGWSKMIRNPQYSQNGTAVVGNIIVKNKATGKYELFCKSWVGVIGFYFLSEAVHNGANGFADNGAGFYEFRRALIAAHAR